MQSRYYSPFLKRFISLDDTGILEATKGEILGANLYAYCNNNPTMNEDPSGYLPRWRHLLKDIRLLTLGMIALISCIWKVLVRSALGALTAKFVGLLADSVLAMLSLGQYWGVIIKVAIIVSIIWRVRSIVRNIPLGLRHIRQFVKHMHR